MTMKSRVCMQYSSLMVQSSPKAKCLNRLTQSICTVCFVWYSISNAVKPMGSLFHTFGVICSTTNSETLFVLGSLPRAGIDIEIWASQQMNTYQSFRINIENLTKVLYNNSLKKDIAYSAEGISNLDQVWLINDHTKDLSPLVYCLQQCCCGIHIVDIVICKMSLFIYLTFEQNLINDRGLSVQ